MRSQALHLIPPCQHFRAAAFDRSGVLAGGGGGGGGDSGGGFSIWESEGLVSSSPLERPALVVVSNGGSDKAVRSVAGASPGTQNQDTSLGVFA